VCQRCPWVQQLVDAIFYMCDVLLPMPPSKPLFAMNAECVQELRSMGFRAPDLRYVVYLYTYIHTYTHHLPHPLFHPLSLTLHTYSHTHIYINKNRATTDSPVYSQWVQHVRAWTEQGEQLEKDLARLQAHVSALEQQTHTHTQTLTEGGGGGAGEEGGQTQTQTQTQTQQQQQQQQAPVAVSSSLPWTFSHRDVFDLIGTSLCVYVCVCVCVCM
jgi:hypothetical protein